jgi:hypothetical protein
MEIQPLQPLQDNKMEYNELYKNFKENYTFIQLLDLCEKHKLSIFGNKEIIIDRLAYHLSEEHKRKDIKYRIMECFTSIKSKFYNYIG